ncbi:MAG: polyphosphate polymerase domain-containing protein [Hespellia sp.]|nr:polyphosphate polymerase domain-containing protein [Hespellia sp.]
MFKEGSIFQRVEKKYRMNPEQYQAFMERTKNRIHLDEFGLHTINNIYFDTDHYDLIRTSIEKPKYKEKFRVRGYGHVTENDPVFLEIKKKYQGIVYKRRVAVPYLQAKAFWEGRGTLPDHDQISREITYFFKFYRPMPKVFLSYDRMAYVGAGDPELRITIDRNIRSRKEHLDLTDGSAGKILDTQNYLMEIKVAQSYPIWLADLLCELELYPISFSKYGTIYTNAVNDGVISVAAAEDDFDVIHELKTEKREENISCLQVF